MSHGRRVRRQRLRTATMRPACPGSCTPRPCNAPWQQLVWRFKSAARAADDIWINVVALRNGHRVRQVRSEARLFPLVSGVQAGGLHQENNMQGRNDEQIEATYTGDDIHRIVADLKRASS